MPSDRENAIRNVVDAWRADHPGAAAALHRLPEADRIEALRRLGYSTRQHLAMFGLEPAGALMATAPDWWGDHPPAVRIDIHPDPTEHRGAALTVHVLDHYTGPVPGFRLATHRTEPLVVADTGSIRAVAGAWYWWPLP